MSLMSWNALLILATALVPVQAQDVVVDQRNFVLDFAGGITIGIVIAVFCICLGLFYLIVGARYPKASVSSNTFIFLAGAIFFTMSYFAVDTLICLIVSLVVAFLAIPLTLKVWKLGLFVLGGGAGFVVWLVVKALSGDAFSDEVTIYVSLCATIVVAALLALKFEKLSFITATSLIGSFILVQGVDALIPNHASVFSLISDTSGLVCSYDYNWCLGLYISVFVIAAIGGLIQAKVTAKYYKKRTEKNKSNYRRRRRGKRAYAKDEEGAGKERDPRRPYRDNKDRDEKKGDDEDREEKRAERRERKEEAASPKSKVKEENAELKLQLRDMERRNQELQTRLGQVWDLTQEEQDLVTRFRVDKRENARIEQEAREAEERERERQAEEARNAKKARKAEKQREKEREREREREREKEAERLRQEEEDAYNVKKSRKSKAAVPDEAPPPYAASSILKEEPKSRKDEKKKKRGESKRRESSDEESAEG